MADGAPPVRVQVQDDRGLVWTADGALSHTHVLACAQTTPSFFFQGVGTLIFLRRNNHLIFAG
jgi:hypothetical protein